ncbi:DUF6500 family protein [Shimia sp. MMG029]|nr:DUF6500 family protein [Shimia sp. MMG029]MDA5555424.1 DUF6500 family protein [Shimia sp. MMG029]
MEAATWWIKTHELDPFEKAVKVRDLILSGAECVSDDRACGMAAARARQGERTPY